MEGLRSGGPSPPQVVVDGRLMQTFQRSFLQVQSLLDQNRLLINEINQNHESRIPDNLGRNVGLIRELNNNIRRVVDLYADLSSKFMEPPSYPSLEHSWLENGGHKRYRPS
ncbi:hypothetical protein SAY87_026033 [Trapa incisa]|uniref:Protein EARLY FLOWERING 4 domain-containing protein n=1 Tax=Trapa incisa TaxID=236973 RepID=A0AAN7GIN7_9MYRT|nr:hypothetical protein SAY87_026033 [Trapa incisa]